jgi:PAS domain S-box-containing protein
MGTADHFVQFYEADGFLMDEVGRFIGTGLGMDDAVVVLATRNHLDGFEERLAVDGVDVAGARERGQYVALDAAETLAAFMTDGGPDERRFVEAIGTLIARALAVSPGRRVRAFGEMVALLLAEGKEDAALRLEGLWNTLARSHTFALFCAYPARGFPRDAHGGSLARICAEHSHVIPSESYTRLASAQARLRSITLLQQKAAALDAATVERKELEKVLHRREQELADFFEHAMEGLQQLGPDRTILWANAAQLDLLGYTAVEYIGHDLAEFGVAPKKDVEDLWRRLTSGESLVNYPAELRCKNGSVRHVLLHASGLWESGSLVYARCFVRDVTERKRLEAELQSKLEQLAEVDRRKDEFLAVLSHELRTPLNTMLGWVRMLRTGQLEGARTSHALEVIERSTRTQARLMRLRARARARVRRSGCASRSWPFACSTRLRRIAPRVR